jgi:AmpD protein
MAQMKINGLEIIKAHLPKQCYSRVHTITPRGILYHFISATHVAPNDPFNVDTIRQILIDYKVSAQYLIDRIGTVWELTPPLARAWHAGKSCYKGIRKLNNSFIGVEFIGTDLQPFAKPQYISGAKLTTYLINEYNIAPNMITGHQMVSDNRVRNDSKHDPGYYFDWLYMGHLVYNELIVLNARKVLL